MNNGHNILQYEFFHIGGKTVSSFDEVLKECSERTAENLLLAMAGDDTGPGIKTVVRIYDADGQVTRLTQRVNELEALNEKYCNAPRSNPFSNWYARWQIERLNRHMDNVKKSIVDYFIGYIGKSFNDERSVAKETWNNAFRPLRRDEYIELHHVAISTKNLWLFVFEPNDLLADENKLVTSIM